MIYKVRDCDDEITWIDADRSEDVLGMIPDWDDEFLPCKIERCGDSEIIAVLIDMKPDEDDCPDLDRVEKIEGGQFEGLWRMKATAEEWSESRKFPSGGISTRWEL